MPSRFPGPAHIAHAIDAGEAIDWASIEADQPDALRRAHVRQLRVLAEILAAHREWSTKPDARLETADECDRRHANGAGEGPLGSWGHLTLLERVGMGAYGEVLRARDNRLDREVALKLLIDPHGQFWSSSTVVIDEGRLLARVRHPNVVAVYGAERIDGRVGIWMEFVHGRSLDVLVRERGPFGATEASAIALELCHALSAVHQAGLLHRDIKARNVMREDGGRIVLMDFGTGRDTHSTAVGSTPSLAGTILYLAPEILAGFPATRQTDVYSLGVLLFHLVTGRYPIESQQSEAVRLAHERQTRHWLADLRPDLPEPFVRIVERAITADPRRRFETPGALASELTNSLSGLRSPYASSQTLKSMATGHAALAHEGRTKVWAAGLAAALLLLAGSGWLVTRQFSRNEPPRVSQTAGIPTVVVTPFVDMGGDPAQAYFADGMADALIGRLSRKPGLRVISAGTRQVLSRGASHAAASSRVNAIVEAAVSRTASRFRIDVRLIDATTARELWARTYERPASDVIAVQIEVADAISARLDADTTEIAASQAERSQVDPVAYEQYLKGRWHWNKRNAEGFRAALQHFNLAIGADPTYAPAHAGLADTYSHLGMFGLMPARDAVPRARAAGARALELDPTLFELRASLAFLDLYEWNWQSAERGFTQALALNPRYATAHHWYALHLVSLGRYDDAELAIQRAMEMDPLSLIIANDSGVISLFRRDFVGAERQIQTVLDIDPNFAEAWSRRGWARIGAARPAEAVADFEHLGKMEPNNAFWTGSLAYAYAEADRKAEARHLVADLEARAARQYMPPLAMVMAYAGLRENDHAFAWMERAYVERSDWLTGLLHPAWDRIRPDPRFADMMRRVGYPAHAIELSRPGSR